MSDHEKDTRVSENNDFEKPLEIGEGYQIAFRLQRETIEFLEGIIKDKDSVITELRGEISGMKRYFDEVLSNIKEIKGEQQEQRHQQEIILHNIQGKATAVHDITATTYEKMIKIIAESGIALPEDVLKNYNLDMVYTKISNLGSSVSEIGMRGLTNDRKIIELLEEMKKVVDGSKSTLNYIQDTLQKSGLSESQLAQMEEIAQDQRLGNKKWPTY